MGSPERITYGKSGGIGIGIGMHYSKFPYEHFISFNLLFWFVSIGIGKAYDEW